jgi:hypothetical protein
MEQCGRYVFASCQCSSLSVRSAGSIGLVIERKRVGEGFTDGLYGTATTATTNCTK